MTTLFCVRPATRNIGNDVINTATADLLYRTFGSGTGIVNIPALKGPQYGGLSARQIFDMNRLADGVVVGGGNLFENGQLTFNSQAVAALTTPAMIIGVSHGRIYGKDGKWVDRTELARAGRHPPIGGQGSRHHGARSRLAENSAGKSGSRTFGWAAARHYSCRRTPRAGSTTIASYCRCVTRPG